jgi:hypothetical protein
MMKEGIFLSSDLLSLFGAFVNIFISCVDNIWAAGQGKMTLCVCCCVSLAT